MIRAVYVKGLEFFPAQAKVISESTGIIAVVAGIGGGKSDMGAWFSNGWALDLRRADGSPPVIGIVGRDLPLVRKVQLAKMMKLLRRLDAPLAAIVRGGEDGFYGGNDPRIEFANGATALGFSGRDPDRMAGHELDAVWIDEADLQPEAVFTMALERQRAGRAPRIIVTSSPRLSGWMRSLLRGDDKRWDDLKARGIVRVYRSRSADNPHLSSEQLALIRAAVEAHTPGLAAQELDGLLLGTEEAPAVGALDVSRAFVERHEFTAPPRAAVLGVDLGKTVDFTWLVVLDTTGVLIHQERFNAGTPGVPRDGFYPWVEAHVARLVSEWRIPVVRLDAAMHGASFAESLGKVLKDKARVEGYRTDSPRRKSEAIEALGVAMASARILVPQKWCAPDGRERRVAHVDQLAREFQELVATQRGGSRTFDHPQGGHDDGVVALALAAQAIEHPGARASPESMMAFHRAAQQTQQNWQGNQLPGGEGSGYIFG